ncbi:MAG: C-GCAxxG-C-C family protein [Eggerthella lenta]
MTTDNACTQRPFDREALGRRALELHGMKYNCAQAVACTLAPLIGADEELCFRAAEGLGGGMGGLTETCGAVSGAAMAIGLANSNGQDDRTSKQATYRIVRKLVTISASKTAPPCAPSSRGSRPSSPCAAATAASSTRSSWLRTPWPASPPTNRSTRSRTMHAVRVVRRNGALGERAIRYHGGDRDETHAERRRSTCPPSLPTSS